MKWSLSAVLAIIIFASFLTGCYDTNEGTMCEHNWEQIQKINEYTAVDKCSICGVTRIYTDTNNDIDSGIEAGVRLIRYNFDGYGIGQKEVFNCDLGYAIIDCLYKLEETGEIIPKISDDEVNEFARELPTEKGTVWLECGTVGMFRLNPQMTEICKVETHLGEGRVLQMTDTLNELLRQAWYYHPYDYWSGAYENGTVTLQQIYKNFSVVEQVAIENIRIENVHHSVNNRITLRILAKNTQTVNIILESYQSDDNLGGFGSKEVTLVGGEETIVEFTFGGFYNYTYWLSIIIDNTKIQLKIDPRNS